MAKQSSEATAEWIVLDSGADVWLLPMRLAHVGTRVKPTHEMRLEDAQGGRLRVDRLRSKGVGPKERRS